MSDVTPPTGGPDRPEDATPDPGPTVTAEPLVDWTGTAHRIARSITLVAIGVVVLWLVTGVLSGGPTLRGLAAWAGGGMAVLFVAEVVVVGGAALRGMLRAGERGERLAGDDVGLVPRLRRRG